VTVLQISYSFHYNKTGANESFMNAIDILYS